MKEYTEPLILAIEQGNPFVIYEDQEHFLLSLPAFKIVICFAVGVIATKEMFSDNEKYINRIKLGMVVYDKFSTVDDFYKNFPAIKDVYLLSKR